MTEMTLSKAIGAGLRRALADDDHVLLMGEDIGELGGVFRVTDGLKHEFGAERVIDTPLAEAGIVGTAIGLAFRGYRAVCEIHSESPEAYFAHTAGLRVVSPSNPQDAYSMLRLAIASDDPIIFFEPKRRYWTKGEVDLEHVALPLDKARVVREGADVTLVTYGPLVATAVDAADAAADEDISIEVIDLRSLSPIDFDTIEDSVNKTGRLVITHEASLFGGLGAEIAATITDRCFYSLEAPPQRVTGFDTPYPPAKLEEHFVPDLDRILDAVDRTVGRENSLTGFVAR